MGTTRLVSPVHSGLRGIPSHSLAIFPGISKFPFFDIPLKATPAFSASDTAAVRSKAAVRSGLIRCTSRPSSRTSSPDARREKQTSETRTAAPSRTQGSSSQASKIAPIASDAVENATVRSSPDRIALPPNRRTSAVPHASAPRLWQTNSPTRSASAGTRPAKVAKSRST